MSTPSFDVSPVGYVRSSLRERSGAPRQGWEDAPNPWLEIDAAFADCLEGLEAGHHVWVLTFLHQARRNTRQVYPRGMGRSLLTGVFACRSPDRPNPIGLHRTKILSIEGTRLHVEGVEAIDGTPVLDIKPVLDHGGGA